MPMDQSVERDMWKFRKGSADAVRQFDEETVTFFDVGRHFPSEILARACHHLSTFLLEVTRVVFWCIWTSITTIQNNFSKILMFKCVHG